VEKRLDVFGGVFVFLLVVYFYFAAGRSVKYCDQRVCLSVCLSVCQLAYLINDMSKLHASLNAQSNSTALHIFMLFYKTVAQKSIGSKYQRLRWNFFAPQQCTKCDRHHSRHADRGVRVNLDLQNVRIRCIFSLSEALTCGGKRAPKLSVPLPLIAWKDCPKNDLLCVERDVIIIIIEWRVLDWT